MLIVSADIRRGVNLAGRYLRSAVSFGFALLVLTLMVSVSCAAASPRYTLITILHTNDIHGRVMPPDQQGGLARAATLVREIRAELPNVLLLDAGDIIHGVPEEYVSGQRATITAMNAAGYSAATLGNHEFDFGLDVLNRVASLAQFPLLAANVRALDGAQWGRIVPYHVFEIEGVHIAVMGLATLDTIPLEWPNRIKDIRIEDPIETARALVPKLREQADVVVALSHLGIVQDRVLVENVPDIDFVVGGHSHTTISEWEWNGDTLITQTGAYGRNLGRIDFVVRTDDTGSAISSVNGKQGSWNRLSRPPLGLVYPGGPLIPVDAGVAVDEEVRDAYLPFAQEAEAILSVVVGEAPEGVPGRAQGHMEESPAGNLVADAVRAFAGSDVAVIDAHSLAGVGLAPGPVTVRAIYDLIGGYTRQHIVLTRMTGRDLQRALDSRFEAKGAVTLGISGASLRYVNEGKTPRIEQLHIGGSAVEPDQAYTVAAQAYVMMDMMLAAPAAVIGEPDESTREAMVDYIRAKGVISPSDLDRIQRVEAGSAAR